MKHALAILIAVVALVAGLLWWSAQPLGMTMLSDGTEITFERFTYGTKHEFGGRDLTKVGWVPNGLLKLTGYKAPLHVVHETPEPHAMLWVRVRRPPQVVSVAARRTAILSRTQTIYNVQALAPDGNAHTWEFDGTYSVQAGEFMALFRADSLPPRGGRLNVRYLEATSRNRTRAEAHTISPVVSIPNPSRVKSVSMTPATFPQEQEQDGLGVRLTGWEVFAMPDAEIKAEPRVELFWKGGRNLDGLHYWWDIGTPGGPWMERGFGVSQGGRNILSGNLLMNDELMLALWYERTPSKSWKFNRLPAIPMPGHSAWRLRLHVATAANFPEFVKERGIPLTAAPVPTLKWYGDNPPAAKLDISPEAMRAGVVRVEEPARLRNGLKVVFDPAKSPWFPTGWRPGDLWPFIVSGEAAGKRRVVEILQPVPQRMGDQAGTFDFDGHTETYGRILNGESSWADPANGGFQLSQTMEAVEYRLIPRRYWTFEFVVQPPELK